MIRWPLACLTLLALAGCGPRDSAAPPDSADPAPAGLTIVEAGASEASARADTILQEAPEAAALELPTVPEVIAYVTVVDLEGSPLQGRGPIVTTQPNAFDEPVSVGGLSGADGKSWVRFTSDKTLFVRAWDPQLQWFPNNFFEVPAGEGTVARDMTITMVPAATIEAQFFLPGGTPAVNTRIELMMSHPDWGPWWPAELITGAQGGGVFPNLPPGKYTLSFQGPGGVFATMHELLLTPGNLLRLGQVPLL